MNHALRRAMANAKMTEAHLAEACGVDAKTVGRWITGPDREIVQVFSVSFGRACKPVEIARDEGAGWLSGALSDR
ncbi:helix-turn-helix transcriptional regulator [Streptomyces sp. XY413]|uniref:helix-turn-helix transcriptional regulator n=1 Tax=Streptomyces sp. XY413 TaxID=1519479 RepID=UPI000AFCD3D1|nr:helix-turn-helix transcriptional regulator [Streptomyces sp. XY413]